MHNVKSEICAHEGCKTRVLLAKMRQKALFCSVHTEDGIVDVIDKRCIQEGRKTCSSFNYENETKTLYCSVHKENRMINVISKKCVTQKMCKHRRM
jgi:hypothetical protein